MLSTADSLQSVFTEQIKIVDELFYQKAKIEYIFADNDRAEYYLNRALQFNKHNVDALILKTKLKFEEKEYEECLNLFKELFNQNTLSEMQENEVYGLSSAYYYEIYNLGDSLVKADKGLNSISGIAKGTVIFISVLLILPIWTAPSASPVGISPAKAKIIPTAYAIITVPTFFTQSKRLYKRMIITGPRR